MNTPDVLAIVPAKQIFEGPNLPEIFPRVLLGIGSTTVRDVTFSRRHCRVLLDLHVWQREPGTVWVKDISSAITSALQPQLTGLDGYRVIGLVSATTRFVSAPGLEHSHAVVRVDALLEEYP